MEFDKADCYFDYLGDEWCDWVLCTASFSFPRTNWGVQTQLAPWRVRIAKIHTSHVADSIRYVIGRGTLAPTEADI